MNIKDFLKANGLTQKQLAEKAGCTAGAISHLCTGRRKPRPEIARRIVKATKGKVSLNDLYAEDELEAA